MSDATSVFTEKRKNLPQNERGLMGLLEAAYLAGLIPPQALLTVIESFLSETTIHIGMVDRRAVVNRLEGMVAGMYGQLLRDALKLPAEPTRPVAAAPKKAPKRGRPKALKKKVSPSVASEVAEEKPSE